MYFVVEGGIVLRTIIETYINVFYTIYHCVTHNL